MQTITNVNELRNEIQLLEVEQDVKWQILKEQFNTAFDSFKPANLFLKTIKEVALGPNLLDNVIGTAIGLTTGYLSKKIVIGTSANIFRKLFGSVLQVGVTNAVAHNPGTIRTLGQFIFEQIFRKKNLNTEQSDR